MQEGELWDLPKPQTWLKEPSVGSGRRTVRKSGSRLLSSAVSNCSNKPGVAPSRIHRFRV